KQITILLNNINNQSFIILPDYNNDLLIDRAATRGHFDVVKELIKVHSNSIYKYSIHNLAGFHPLISAAYWWNKTLEGLKDRDKRLGIFNETESHLHYYKIMRDLISNYDRICNKTVNLSTADITHNTNALYYIVRLLCQNYSHVGNIEIHKKNAFNIAKKLISCGVSLRLKNHCSMMNALDVAKKNPSLYRILLHLESEYKSTPSKLFIDNNISSKPFSIPSPIKKYEYNIIEPVFEKKLALKPLAKSASTPITGSFIRPNKKVRTVISENKLSTKLLTKSSVTVPPKKSLAQIPFQVSFAYVDQVLNEIVEDQKMPTRVIPQKTMHTNTILNTLLLFDIDNAAQKKQVTIILKKHITLQHPKKNILNFFKQCCKKECFFYYDLEKIKSEIDQQLFAKLSARASIK
ncbi:MAG: hypothetical protein JO131_06295, partial [Gammaproteobacteria bacterium]|nr:hypothetical protein [Gammaproteobacteria bacterium]